CNPTRFIDMPTYTISKLARIFGLSRSALLYYDRIGLLPPSGRTGAGYRCYSEDDRAQLEQICAYRQAGLTIEDIRALQREQKPGASILRQRLQAIGREIQELQSKRRYLLNMFKMLTSQEVPAVVDTAMWIGMLRSAGMDERSMACWHAEFEKRAPEAHHEFLLSLGIPENEALEIRTWSEKSMPSSDPNSSIMPKASSGTAFGNDKIKRHYDRALTSCRDAARVGSSAGPKGGA
ncbi:MAG: MerR family transcriptional regulator, partial [Desulfobacterales bacterium]|nr:MerR family transcriptional regulator [Desulfobacterales bacterium]